MAGIGFEGGIDLQNKSMVNLVTLTENSYQNLKKSSSIAEEAGVKEVGPGKLRKG